MKTYANNKCYSKFPQQEHTDLLHLYRVNDGLDRRQDVQYEHCVAGQRRVEQPGTGVSHQHITHLLQVQMGLMLEYSWLIDIREQCLGNQFCYFLNH